MEELNRLLGYYESCVDLLESISKRTEEQNIKLKLYKNFILDLERLIRVFNYEKGNSHRT